MGIVLIIWLLLIVSTGFRIIERGLRLSAAHKYYSLQNIVLRSLLVGTWGSFLTIVSLALVIAISFVLAPSQTQYAEGAVRVFLSRWLPPTPGNAVIVYVTASLFLSFLLAPQAMLAGQRIRKLGHGI
ncbi:hypothetical protein [Pseudomonas sp. 18173]|uniref:hypothetical protein n=1 Tax=Pseudomonas sp. 18173 TaxID=3390055 RepID=UPI003D2154A6